MGQLATRPTGGEVKTDANPDYQTNGDENDVDFVQDFNCEYQPSDYDEMYDETSSRRGTSQVPRPTLAVGEPDYRETGPKVKSINARIYKSYATDTSCQEIERSPFLCNCSCFPGGSSGPPCHGSSFFSHRRAGNFYYFYYNYYYYDYYYYYQQKYVLICLLIISRNRI